MSFPRPTINDVKQDDSSMRYVNGGDFARSEIGGGAPGLPKSIKTERMNIKHIDQAK